MENIDSIVERMRTIFVTSEVFNLRITPIEKIVYGLSTAIGLGVIGAILALILQRPKI